MTYFPNINTDKSKEENMSFGTIQDKYERARVRWAERGGRINFICLCFWDWFYRRQKVPQ